MSIENLRQRMQADTSDPQAVQTAPMIIRENKTFRLSVSELKSAVESNPEHPHASIYRRAVKGMANDDKITVDKVDLEALLDDAEVKEDITPLTDEAGDVYKVARKKLVPRKGKPQRPVPAPRKPETKTDPSLPAVG